MLGTVLGPPVNTVRTSFVTSGIISTSAGGVVIDAWGLRAPLWLGAAMAVTGLLTVLPDFGHRAATRTSSVVAGSSTPAERPERS
ncbi:hypothetical protein [Streptomyces thermoviolaceus]|uniref:hypothetical protein n=1 Tax=Streptomyces thermoviolaceus TaxID=1952 RepID=UPI0019A389E5|nr:hypothetical protein [Streptomyces thermoviolaceus]GGV64651.1 hypothetical protein GCM10010499_08510 [Streptomyces thermoviolaceus subsp. apingens]GHA99759.1 hypothetical protein GCM10010512_34020 [Streptomyces thermoviolaceus subsp. thermoviolaceus]